MLSEFRQRWNKNDFMLLNGEYNIYEKQKK